MDNKKKQVLFFVPLFIVFCMLFLGGYSSVEAFDEDKPNTSLNNNWLSQDSMLKILTGLKIDKYNGNINFLQNYCNVNSLDYDTQSGDIARAFSTSFNRWFNNASYNYDINLNNLLFMWGIPTFNSSSFYANTYLTINIYSQGSIYVTDVPPYLSQFDDSNHWGNGRWTKWNSWNYDSNNNISGVNTSSTTNTTSNIWMLTTTNCTQESNLQSNSTYTPYGAVGYRENFSQRIYTTIWAPLSVSGDFTHYHDICYHKNSNPQFYGADSLYYHIDIVVDNSTPIPTPTPVPTGSGGSSDLTNIENSLTNIENSLTYTPSGDDFQFFNSGDLVNVVGINIDEDENVGRMNNFWFEMTNGLITALTNDVRYISFQFNNKTVTFDNQAYNISIVDLKNFVRLITIVGFVVAEYKTLRKLANMFKSGIFSQIFNMYSRIDISDFF